MTMGRRVKAGGFTRNDLENKKGLLMVTGGARRGASRQAIAVAFRAVIGPQK